LKRREGKKKEDEEERRRGIRERLDRSPRKEVDCGTMVA